MTDEQLYHLHVTGMTYRDIAQAYGFSVDSVRGRVGRFLRKRLKTSPAAQSPSEPLLLRGDWMIAGDVHLPAANNHLVERFLAVARHWLEPPRRCILAGDLVNAEAFSLYDSPIIAPPFELELQAARSFFDKLLGVFDQVVVLPGNHDRRISKRTRGAVSFSDLMRMIRAGDDRIVVSNYGYAVLETEATGSWLITHGSQYSVTPLGHAERTAWKHGLNVISHHEHRLALGYDRYGRHILVNNGGLFDVLGLPYVWLDSSSRSAMVGGFTMMRRGYPYVFGGWIDWQFWLSERKANHGHQHS